MEAKKMRIKILGGCFIAVLLSAVTLTSANDIMLVDAVKKRDKEAVRSLLKQQFDVNVPEADGATALQWAAYWDDLETAELLIRAGARVNAANDYGVTPLMLACTNGNGAMVEMLLKGGADPNSTLPTGVTALMTCARTSSVEPVKLLLENGAKTHLKELRSGQTALMWAVAQKQAKAAELLIQHGADIHARSEGGLTPLLFAARVGDVASARVLLAAGANVNDALLLNGSPGVANRERPAAGIITPLLMASASGHEAISIFLLEQGADPNAWDGGAAPLHYAMMEGTSYLHDRSSMDELVRVLLTHGADLNVRFERTIVTTRGFDTDNVVGRGATPFLMAAAAPDPRLMRALLAAGADPNMTTSQNVTALMTAAGVGRSEAFTKEQQNDALEAIKIIVGLGADVDAANDIGRTALHGATQMVADPIIQFLAEHGANVDARDVYQQTPLSAAMGIRLPWVPMNRELGEEGAIRQSTADLLLELGATPLDTPGYFKPVEEDSDIYRLNPQQTNIPSLN